MNFLKVKVSAYSVSEPPTLRREKGDVVGTKCPYVLESELSRGRPGINRKRYVGGCLRKGELQSRVQRETLTLRVVVKLHRENLKIRREVFVRYKEDSKRDIHTRSRSEDYLRCLLCTENLSRLESYDEVLENG